MQAAAAGRCGMVVSPPLLVGGPATLRAYSHKGASSSSSSSNSRPARHPRVVCRSLFEQQRPGGGVGGGGRQAQGEQQQVQQRSRVGDVPPPPRPPPSWSGSAPDSNGNGVGAGANPGAASSLGGTPGGGGPPEEPPPNGPLGSYTKAIVAAAFIVGLGVGVYFDAEINLHPSNVASTEILDRRTPNSGLCMAYGYSSMVFDQRIFVTYNPFNVYVTQPEVKPGCVLRRSNFNVLERDRLVDGKTAESCKRRMNTFGFVGDLAEDPEISCLYHSEEAENQYLVDPRNALNPPGSKGATSLPSPSPPLTLPSQE